MPDAAGSDRVLPASAYDLSVMLGGPLYQLYRRSRLSGDALQLLHRRIAVLTVIAWVPLLLLSLSGGRAWTGSDLPFLRDVAVQVRLLISLPLLIAAELIVHRRMVWAMQQFGERKLVGERARAAFDAAVASALRWRNSVALEVALLIFVYTVALPFGWRHVVKLDLPTWYQTSPGGFHPTQAGLWFMFVSLPLYQFLFYRWYVRLFILGRFLWQISRAKLDLVPLHPDRMAGLGFINGFAIAFVPLLLAQAALMAGKVGDDILYGGVTLAARQVEIVVMAVVIVLIVISPLLVFIPTLHHQRLEGLREYGALGQDYVRTFRAKWLRGTDPGEPLIGSADIQSLADLANSYEVVKDIEHLPLTRRTLIVLLAAALVPFTPLLLTQFSFSELMERVVKMLV